MPIVLLAALACGFARPDVLMLTRPVVRSIAFSTRHAVVLAAGKPAGAGRRVARRQVASNKMARRNFEIVQELEAGVSLYGTEVKSCRDGRIQLRAAACDECSRRRPGAGAYPARSRHTPSETQPPPVGCVAGDGYCKVSDGECWLHNVNIAMCTSNVKRTFRPCPSSAPAPPLGAPGGGLGSGRLDTPRRGDRATGRPATASVARAGRLQGRRFHTSTAVGSAGTRPQASSFSMMRRARAGCCCTRRLTLAVA